MTSPSLVSLPQHDPPTHKRLLYSLVFGRVKGILLSNLCFGTIFPAPMSFNTTLIFTALHLELDGYFPLFIKNYEPNQDLEFFYDSFKLTF